MPGIDQIVTVNITRGAQAVEQAAFSIPLIMGPTLSPTGWGTDKVRAYTTADAMLTDGFTSSNPEYIFAQQLTSQSIRPSTFLIGRRSSAVAGDLAGDIAAVSAVNNGWYALVLAGAADADIIAAATYIESVKKILVAASDTAAIATNVTTDIGSTLKTSAYNRTALLYAKAGKSQGIAAGWVGGQCAVPPGSNTWAFKNIAGITADTLTDNEALILFGSPVSGVVGKNVNTYQRVAGNNITQMGTMASGQFIDLTIGIDWLESRMKEGVYSAIVNAPKLPYTDNGVSVLLQVMRQVLDAGVANGLIDGNSDITVSAPSVNSVSSQLRAQRKSPPLSFACRFSGAIHSAEVRGNVTI